MARVVKEQEYALKRNDILDAARRLVETRGYEQMSIQDLLDDLRISRGAFYHYFDSKHALLEALVGRMLEEMERLITPTVHDPHLPALEKLHLFFARLVRWKTAQRTFALALMRTWHADENALLRQKVRVAVARRLTPLLTAIVHQGVREGVLAPSYPDRVGEVVTNLAQDLSEALVELVLSFDPNRPDLRPIEDTIAAYTDAMERVLGAPSGSLRVIDAAAMEEWTVSPSDILGEGNG